MKISELFEKPIYREINGVIKVDQLQDDEIFMELDEFVITKELRRHFIDFYNSYNKSLETPTDKMGVWVSGFFGSGKSHFIKMLSYLLENREVKGKKAVEFFETKINKEDKMLCSNIIKASKYPTDVILFNIDSRSNADSRSSKMHIVEVFMKVFNHQLGYCSEIPWVAEIERILDEEGFYDTFKSYYLDLSGQKWEDDRDKTYFIRDDFVNALIKTKGISEESAGLEFDRAESNYTLSVEKFAEQVKKYLDKKNPKRRIVFLVDEIGQYIGDNTSLMLNLQTVVENLGTFCKGRAWVVVTSQEAIDALTKDRFRDQDFSKIQGRFDTRLNLSSSNTDEVIKSRLLGKTFTAQETLNCYYTDYKAILSNLISFSPKTVGMRPYLEEKDFTESYPFITYQFLLLQKVFEAIRKYSHAGLHLSEGERSMLNAFHNALKDKGGQELRSLVPFNTFYRTVESFLDSSIKRIFTRAEASNNFDSFDLEVLKTLFMIKYIDKFPGDIDNIATLMITNIDEDKIALKSKIDGALTRLKQETLIQQNGEEYTFLTDEEQDVNRGIKAEKIDFTDVIDKVYEKLYSEIYDNRAYKYSKFNTYSFSKYVDGCCKGKPGEDLTIRILTPEDEDHGYGDDKYKMQTSNNGLLMIKLPDDRKFFDEAEWILKTERYLKMRSGTKEYENVKRVLDSKKTEISQRNARLKELLEQALLHADYYASGEKLDTEGNTPKSKIEAALRILVQNTFYKLPLIKVNIFDNRDLHNILTGPIQQRADGGNKAAEDDMYAFIKQKSDFDMVTSMKDIKDRYYKKPYGWAIVDIAGVVASITSQGLIKIEYNGETFETSDRELINLLTKEKEFDRLTLSAKPIIDEDILESVKKVGREIFNSFDLPNDPDDLFHKMKTDFIKPEKDQLEKLLLYYANNTYPGKEVLKEGLAVLMELEKIKDASVFFEQITAKQDFLNNWKVKFLMVKEFLKGNQREIFDKAIKCLNQYENNRFYLKNDDLTEIINKLRDITSNNEPYSQIKDIPYLVQSFNSIYDNLLKQKKAEIIHKIESNEALAWKEVEQAGLKENYRDPFVSLKTDLEQTLDFDAVVAFEVKSDTHLNKILAWINETIEKIEKEAKSPEANDCAGSGVGGITTRVSEPKIETKKIKTIKLLDVSGDKVILETEDEVNEYVDKLRNCLIQEIRNNNRVKLS